MNYYKLAFYIKAENLEDAYQQLLEKMNGAKYPDSEELITEQQFEEMT